MAQEYDSIFTKDVELRLKAIESAMDQIWHMMQNSISREQLNRLNVVRQRQLERIETRINTLTADVAELESKVDGLL